MALVIEVGVSPKPLLPEGLPLAGGQTAWHPFAPALYANIAPVLTALTWVGTRLLPEAGSLHLDPLVAFAEEFEAFALQPGLNNATPQAAPLDNTTLPSSFPLLTPTVLAPSSLSPATGTANFIVTEDTPELTQSFVLASGAAPEDYQFTLTAPPDRGTVRNNGDGTFTFVLDNSFQWLNTGESETVQFRYVATDGMNQETGEITITVTGEDGKFEVYQDNPVIDFYLWDAPAVDRSLPTYVLTHGWRSAAGQTEPLWTNLADSIRDFAPRSNVVFMNWGALGATLNYNQAADTTVNAGRRLGRFLDRQNLAAKTTQVIGHSLGAHVAGMAGDLYDDLTGGSIGAVVGLDPAGPGFEPTFFGLGGRGPERRLDAADSDRVIAFHTSRTLGYDGELGDLDLYVNWNDLLQPGQLSFVGNHNYPLTLLAELFQGKTFLQPDGSSFNQAALETLSGRVEVDTTQPVAPPPPTVS